MHADLMVGTSVRRYYFHAGRLDTLRALTNLGHLHADACVGARGTSSTLSTLRANPDSGELHFVGNQPTVEQPRGFEVDPTGRYLVAAGELSDHLALYRIEPTSGELVHVSDAPTGNKTNWVEIVSFP